ncbi:MAG: hypothetical protein ABI760_14180 [Ferruginibacter sp.]
MGAGRESGAGWRLFTLNPVGVFPGSNVIQWVILRLVRSSEYQVLKLGHMFPGLLQLLPFQSKAWKGKRAVSYHQILDIMSKG